MKKSLVGLLAISLVLFAAGSASAVSLWLGPSSYSHWAENGTSTTVDLLIQDVKDPGVDTLQLILTFDTSLLQATGIAAEDLEVMGTVFYEAFVDIDGEAYTTFGVDPFAPDNVNGQMSFTLWNVGSLGATGCGTVATITFTTDSSNEGTSALDYTSWLLEPTTGKPITHKALNGSIRVGPIPEPATLMLVAAGMAALGGYARKKKRS
jgi:hypothetical protein